MQNTTNYHRNLMIKEERAVGIEDAEGGDI